MNQNFGPGKTTGHNAYAAACAADKAFQAELKRQFGERAGDFRYRRDCHDMKTAEARDAFKAATAAMRDAMRAGGDK